MKHCPRCNNEMIKTYSHYCKGVKVWACLRCGRRVSLAEGER